VVAHPVSHTDAWVKVEDTVKVRLNVFLDDVLLHQGCLKPDLKSIASAKVMQAISSHSDLLLRQLRIFDDKGRPLSGSIVKVPDWRTDQDSIDPVAEASEKLTWDLVYTRESVEDDLRSLVFIHDFTHESLQQPGELRLHLQLKKSGQRIDAVIPPTTPHTIVFPAENDASAVQAYAAGADTDANSATSRIMIGPAHVTHEFTAPLLLLDSAWPAAVAFSRLAGEVVDDERAVSVESLKIPELERQLSDWFRTNTSIRVDGKVSAPSGVIVHFLPAAVAQNATGRDGLSVSEDLPLFGTLVGIRMRYPRGRSLKKIQLEWFSSPGAFSGATVHVVSSRESVSQLVPVLSSPQSGESVLNFHWEPVSRRAIRIEESPTVGAIEVSDSVVSLTSSYSFSVRIFGCTFLGMGLIAVLAFFWKKASFVTRLIFPVVSVLVLVLIWQQLATNRVSVDSSKSLVLTQRLLRSVYNSLLETDEQAVLEKLHNVLHDDFAEDVYLSMISTISADDDPLLDIQAVTVQSCNAIENLSSNSAVTADCQWTVDGIVKHWGHSHRRTFIMSGQLTLLRSGDRWKILSLSRAEVIPMAAETS